MPANTDWEAYLLAQGFTITEHTATHPSRIWRTARRSAAPAAPSPVPQPSSEAAFLAKIRALAKVNGWRVYHTQNSRRSEEGFPDLVLAKPGRLIFAELKTTTGKLTAAQAIWLSMLHNTIPNLEVYLWRPDQEDQIVACLTRRTGP
jgi:hypothetical protein